MNQSLEVVRNILMDEIREKRNNPNHPITVTLEQAETLYVASDPPKFINCGTVCVSLLPVVEGLVVIRRGNPTEDGFGKLGLIGGFQEGKISEPVRVTAVREMEEEVGLQIFTHLLKLVNVETDDYKHNVVFFSVDYGTMPTWEDIQAQARIDPKEVSELVLLTECPRQEEVAFPFHYYEIRDFFLRRRNANA